MIPAINKEYSQTTLLFIQDSKKTRNNSSTESINHCLRLRLTHAHICSIGFKSGLYAGSQRILCPCCSNNSWISALLWNAALSITTTLFSGNAGIRNCSIQKWKTSELILQSNKPTENKSPLWIAPMALVWFFNCQLYCPKQGTPFRE